MATGSSSSVAEYAMSIRYGDKNKPMYFSGNKLVEYVIKKAACELQVPKADRDKLVLVHMGSVLPGKATLKDLLKANKSTCCFLQLSSADVHSSLTRTQLCDFNNREDVGKCFGFCTQCGSIVQIRPRFTCSLCKKGNFILDGPINFFDDDHNRITGTCHSCSRKGKPDIVHECAAEVGGTPHRAVFMYHLRENVLKLPCMKCEDKQDVIFKFHCNHTMCMTCYSTMCKMLLEVDGFTQDDSIGFSLGCPGGGSHCSLALITDPHHFYLVDGKKEFYKLYHEKAIKAFQEHETGPSCQKCQSRLDTSRTEEAEVEMPSINNLNVEESLPLETGGVWLSIMKKFKKKPAPQPAAEQPKKITTRQRIKCGRCQSLYCGECHLIWHEGDCIKMSSEQKKAAHQFQVEKKKAAASEWR